MKTDIIHITLPCDIRHAAIVRMVVAAIAGEQDLTYEETDDLRIAAQEAFIYAVETQPDKKDIKIAFRFNDEKFEIIIDLGRKPTENPLSKPKSSYALFVMSETVDSTEVTGTDNAIVKITKKLEKSK